MGDTLQGNQVLIFGGEKDIYAWPVVMLGIDPNGQPQPVAVSTSGGATAAPLVCTPVFFHVANSGSTTIPTTAKRWAVNFVGSGTANTFGTNTAVTGNQSFSDQGAPASAIAIACDGSTVADGFYSTT